MKKKISVAIKIVSTITLIFIIYNKGQNIAVAGIDDIYDWPRFSLLFQHIQDYNYAVKKFSLVAGSPSSSITSLTSRKKNILFFPTYGLVRTYRLLSNKAVPDYDYITTYHPDWLLKYKNGSLVMDGYGEVMGPRLDIGNPEYVDWVIQWLRRQAGIFGYKNFYLDGAIFYYANPKWAKYDTNESFRNVWEFFLRRVGEALRPDFTIIINVGSSDLETFTRMVRWVDGAAFETVALLPFHKNSANLEANRREVLDRLAKGKWCVKEGKIWHIRHETTIKALSLSPGSANQPRFISVTDQMITITGPDHKVIGKIDLSSPDNATVANLAENLKKYELNVKMITPYPETQTQGAFQSTLYERVTEGLVLNLKNAPRESFLFGYAAVLMAAGKNTYFNLKSENKAEFYYPEMDWKLGAPQEEMKEIEPFVYRRKFEHYTALVNLSDKPYQYNNFQKLMPLRGAIIK